MPGNLFSAVINAVSGSGSVAIRVKGVALYGLLPFRQQRDALQSYVSPGTLKPEVTLPISAVEISLA